jgi:hypothetical protein
MEDKLIESIAYILPAAVTGFVAYYMFNGFIQQKNKEKKMELLAERKKESLPIKLQAYERMLLFCERINPVKMLLRVKPLSEDTSSYLKLIIANIDQEFEHNLVQQIYISKEAWLSVVASKRAVVNKLKQVAEVSNSANDFRENILIDFSKALPPTEIAVDFIKNEVNKLL